MPNCVIIIGVAQKKKNRLSPRSANFVRHTAALDDFWMSLSFASAPSRKSPSSTVDDRESVELVTPAAVPSIPSDAKSNPKWLRFRCVRYLGHLPGLSSVSTPGRREGAPGAIR